MVKRYRSEAFAAIHETMEALHEIADRGQQKGIAGDCVGDAE